MPITETPLTRPTAEYFAPLAALPDAILLDSQGVGRFDLMTAKPIATAQLVSLGDELQWQHAGWPGADVSAPSDMMEALQAWGRARPVATDRPSDQPFWRGLIGHWGYAAPAEKGLPRVRSDHWPLVRLAWFEQGVLLDHEAQRCRTWHVGTPSDGAAWQQCLQRNLPPLAPFQLLAPFRALTAPARYADDIARIHEHILAGDCYQLNYTQCWQARAQGDPWVAYQHVREQSRAPYGVFWQQPHGALLVLSPEQFLARTGDRLITRPIKGTEARRADQARDAAAAQDLRDRLKDRAENVMITDLLRNDLSKHAVPGTVTVPDLCALESFGEVHHLVTTIEAQLKPGTRTSHLLRDAFPGGSITGTPKRQAMTLIDALEVTPRGPYCGSVFYWDADTDQFDSNITIRTLTVEPDGTVRAWAGGGITIDSQWASELAECYTKMGPVMNTLAAGLLTPR